MKQDMRIGSVKTRQQYQSRIVTANPKLIPYTLEDIEKISHTLKVDTAVTSLTLCETTSCRFPEGAINLLLNALQAHPSIISLTIDSIDYEWITSSLERLGTNTSLTKLELNYISNLGDESAAALYDALAQNTGLTELRIFNCNIGSEGAKALAKALEKNTTLKILDLENNNIDAEGTEALAAYLAQNTGLTELRLQRNEVGTEGAKALAKALEKNTELEKLVLSYNKISQEGGRALAEAVAQNTGLTELRLGHNEVGSEGAKALAKALENNTALQTLDLEENNICDEGLQAFAAVLKVNSSLEELGLLGNRASDTAAEQFLKALDHNMNIRICKIDNADFYELLEYKSEINKFFQDYFKAAYFIAKISSVKDEADRAETVEHLREAYRDARGLNSLPDDDIKLFLENILKKHEDGINKVIDEEPHLAKRFLKILETGDFALVAVITRKFLERGKKFDQSVVEQLSLMPEIEEGDEYQEVAKNIIHNTSELRTNPDLLREVAQNSALHSQFMLDTIIDFTQGIRDATKLDPMTNPQTRICPCTLAVIKGVGDTIKILSPFKDHKKIDDLGCLLQTHYADFIKNATVAAIRDQSLAPELNGTPDALRKFIEEAKQEYPEELQEIGEMFAGIGVTETHNTEVGTSGEGIDHSKCDLH